MEKLDSILKKLIIFLLITGLTFLMLDISFTELETVRSQKINKEQELSSLQKEVVQLEKEIEDLEKRLERLIAEQERLGGVNLLAEQESQELEKKVPQIIYYLKGMR